MPIMDGYKATHTIRTQEPFRDRIKDIPIVAMTASAIQGDKEKCQKAGMDDYLSKPVRGHVLEKMLLKWTMQGRGSSQALQRHQSPGLASDYSIDSSVPSRPYSPPLRSNKPTLSTSQGPPSSTSMTPAQGELLASVDGHTNSTPRAKATSHTSSLLYLDTTGSTTETTEAIQQRRLQTEEKASSLRDEKMLSATDAPRTQHQLFNDDDRRGGQGPGPSHQLTRANLDRHTSDQVLGSGARIQKESVNPEPSEQGSLRSISKERSSEGMNN
jgi:hypothetical protein